MTPRALLFVWAMFQPPSTYPREVSLEYTLAAFTPLYVLFVVAAGKVTVQAWKERWARHH